MTIASVATYGYEVAVVVDGIVKGVAAASIGAGARVGVGSTNGALGVVGPSGVGGASLAAAAPLKFSIGRALKNAAPGDFFPVLIQPEQIV
jgi:hypothetical protein